MVIIALVLAALLGFLALSIDGSNNYLQRRSMQNAADGAAIAGAVELATGQSNELALCSVIREYAVNRQGADSDKVSMFYTPRDVPIQCLNQPTPDWTNGVRVQAGHQFNGYVSGIVGRPTFTVFAEATAQFGTAKAVSGLSPIAISNFDFTYGASYKIWGHDCNQHGDDHHDDDGGYHDDAYQSNDHGGGSGCTLDSGDITGANAALLDLSCAYPNKCNTGDALLKQWTREGYHDSTIFERTRMQGDPAGKYGWEQEHRDPPRDTQHILREAHVGQVLIMPVYDIAYHYTIDQKCNDDPSNHRDVGGSYDPGPNPGQCHNNPAYGQYGWSDPAYATIVDTYTDNGTYNNKYYYNIVSFAAFKVDEIQDHGDNKYIRGHFVRYVAPQGELGGANDKGVMIIKMTR